MAKIISYEDKELTIEVKIKLTEIHNSVGEVDDAYIMSLSCCLNK